MFRINTDGSSFTVLTNAPAISKLAHHAGLCFDQNGTLYGVGYNPTNLLGLVFKLNPDGSGLTTLHGFPLAAGECGYNPDTRL